MRPSLSIPSSVDMVFGVYDEEYTGSNSSTMTVCTAPSEAGAGKMSTK